jgi:hypothetical protein
MLPAPLAIDIAYILAVLSLCVADDLRYQTSRGDFFAAVGMPDCYVVLMVILLYPQD